MDRRCIVVIPAYDEADTIEEVASRAARHCDVCVIDDASTDETGEIAERLERVHCIRHSRNTHIAGAILDGFRYALEQGYDACITMDAGMSHDPDALPLFQARTEADLVIGYREQRIGVPLQRRALSAAGTALMNLVLAGRLLPWGGAGLRDCTSGYRLYSRRAVQLLLGSKLRSHAFDFHIEALARVFRGGLRIEEVPIAYRFANSSLRPQIVWEALRTCARLGFADRA